MRMGVAGKVYLGSLVVFTIVGFSYYVRDVYPFVSQSVKSEAGYWGFVAYFIAAVIGSAIISVIPWWLVKAWRGLKHKKG